LIHFYKRFEMSNFGEAPARGAGMVKRLPIGALQPTTKDFVLVALMVGRSESRRFMKKDGSERFVTNFTLRDSPTDIINLTLWNSREEVEADLFRFKIGSVIEVTRARVNNRDFGSDQEKFSPSVTSPFQLVNIPGETMISPHVGDHTSFQNLVAIPTKASAGYFSINDVLECKNLVGKYVDLCVAIKSVGPIKTFQGKEGEEKKVRDVKLFDLTSMCMVMKVWDTNVIEMAECWLPRHTILFLADVKVGFDSWRECNTVTCTGKTIITENPNIGEAKTLARYCQTVDFSSNSRMDSIIARTNLDSVTQVHNVFSLQKELNRVHNEKEAVLLTNIFGYITRFDLDQDQAPLMYKCGHCCFVLQRDESGALTCQNIDCREFRSRAESRPVIVDYNVKVDISDETGTILSCNLRSDIMEKMYGVKANDFVELSGASKTSFKWDLFLSPMKLLLGIMLPTLERRAVVITVVNLQHANLEEMCSKMPTPVFQ